MHKIADISRLSPKQSLAITALLTYPTIRKAASEAGVAERTIYTWLETNEAFCAELNSKKQELIEAALRRLIISTSKAQDVLEELMSSENESIRMQAAVHSLNLVFKFRDLSEKDRRLTKLERTRKEKDELRINQSIDAFFKNPDTEVRVGEPIVTPDASLRSSSKKGRQ